MLTLAPSAVEAVDSLLHRPEVPEDAGLRIRSVGESELTLEIVHATLQRFDFAAGGGGPGGRSYIARRRHQV